MLWEVQKHFCSQAYGGGRLKGHPQCGLGMSTFCGMGVGIEGALTGIGMLGGTQQVHFQALAH